MNKLPLCMVLLFISAANILPAGLILLSPIGGEVLTVNGRLVIEWEADSTITKVVARLSVDNGYRYFKITDQPIDRSNTTIWGHFPFRIPAVLTINHGDTIYTTSDSCRVEILDYLNESTVYDVSPGMFSIRSADSIRENNISISDKSEVLSFFGSDSAKLVFVNKKANATLCMVDFSENNPRIRNLAYTSDVQYTSISPDGNFVAYNTFSGNAWLLELLGSAVPVKIDSPAYEPRFAKSNDTLYVVYTNVSTSNPYDAFEILSFKTLKKNVVVQNVQGNAITVSEGAYSGGISSDGQYLASGPGNPGTGACLKNLLTGDTFHVHRLKVAAQGQETIISPQICNTSISKSTIYSDAILYRDAGNGQAAFPPLGGLWGPDQYIFLSRKDNKIYKAYEIPDRNIDGDNGSVSDYSWNGMEWSTHPYYAITGCEIQRRWFQNGKWDQQSNWEQIVAVNLKDSSYLTLLQSVDTTITSNVDMQFPYLWVKIPDGFIETNWLDKSLENISVEKKNLFSEKSCLNLIIKNSILTSNKPIKFVKIFDVRGRKVAFLRGDALLNVNLAPFGTEQLAAGLYTLSVRSVNNETAVIRWIVLT